MRWAVVIVITLLAGCAHTVPATRSTVPTYAQGFADGQRMAIDDLRMSDAFHVPKRVLRKPDGRVSALPKSGVITQDQWWASRGRNIWTIQNCVKNAESKRTTIIQMLDEVRQ